MGLIQSTNICDLSGVDSIVQSVIQKFIDRSKFGEAKYGTNLDRTDLNVNDWIQHAQEELMDGILYLEKLRETINDSPKVKKKKINKIDEMEW